MRYFPIFSDTSDRTVLVVGGSEAAAQKVRLLLKSQARLKVVSLELNGELQALSLAGRIIWLSQAFSEDHLTGTSLVFAAADDATNEIVSVAARARAIPVNAVDNPALSTFIMPALVDRDPLVVAIGTEGSGPVLAQGVRARIEALLPPGIGKLAAHARTLRHRIGRTIPAGKLRREFWDTFFFGPVRAAFLEADMTRFNKLLEHEISGHATPARGRIRLVGVPAGDLELMTLKAHRALQEADVIMHDGARHTGALEYARRDAERIGPANDETKTDPVGRLAQLAAQGHDVVQLVDSADLAFMALCDQRLPCGTLIEVIEPAASQAVESASDWASLVPMTPAEIEQWRIAA